MQENKLTLPVAIIVAGVVIAGAIVFSSRTKAPANQGSNIQIAAVSSSDHILGDPNADMVIVEYSDLECPFCKTFHSTMHQLMDAYGKDGKVAWVFRQFPLDKPITQDDGTTFVLHSKAGTEAQAAECTADLGGNDAFWKFIDKIYSITPSNNGLDLSLLPKTAADIGLDKTQFQDCLSSGKEKAKVDAQYNDGVLAGASGTPYSVIITKRGDKIPITEGALPFGALKQIVDAIEAQLSK